MKDKKIFKKWWFWVIAALIVLGAIGSIGQSEEDTSINPESSISEQADAPLVGSTLPELNEDDYKDKEGLIVYTDLKSLGYTVEAEFENQALTDINGKASDVFESANPEIEDDRLSVDAFVVGGIVQNGNSVTLKIVLKPTN